MLQNFHEHSIMVYHKTDGRMLYLLHCIIFFESFDKFQVKENSIERSEFTTDRFLREATYKMAVKFFKIYVRTVKFDLLGLSEKS